MAHVTTPANHIETQGQGAKFEQPKPESEAAEAKKEAKVEEKPVEQPKPDDDGVDDAQITDKIRKLINKKHRAMKEAEEFAQSEYGQRKAAEKRAEELEAQIEELKSRAAPQVSSDKEPDRKDFASDAEYWDAKIDWKADQKVKASEAKRLEAEAKARQESLEAARIERNKVFAATVPDYEETLQALADEDLEVPPHIGQYLYESDVSAQVMYHFAKNPDEFKRIAGLSPIKAIAAIGKLEARLESAPKKGAESKLDDTKPVTRAPAPIETLGNSSAPVITDPAKMNFQQLREYRRQEALQKAQRH